MKAYNQIFFTETTSLPNAFERFSGFAAPQEVIDFVETPFRMCGKDPNAFFVQVGISRQKPYWCIICFDDELQIPGHIVHSRNGAKISFGQYSDPPNYPDPNFIPSVGFILIEEEQDLLIAKENSKLFKNIWIFLNNQTDRDFKFVCVDTNSDIDTNFLYGALKKDMELWKQYIDNR